MSKQEGEEAAANGFALASPRQLHNRTGDVSRGLS
jgi:hypothetical protein